MRIWGIMRLRYNFWEERELYQDRWHMNLNPKFRMKMVRPAPAHGSWYFSFHGANHSDSLCGCRFQMRLAINQIVAHTSALRPAIENSDAKMNTLVSLDLHEMSPLVPPNDQRDRALQISELLLMKRPSWTGNSTPKSRKASPRLIHRPANV